MFQDGVRELTLDEYDFVSGGLSSADKKDDPNQYADFRDDIVVTGRRNGSSTIVFNAPAVLTTGNIPNIPFKTIPGEGTNSKVTLPKGTTVTGTDADNNGIPDIVEDLVKAGNLKFQNR
ncbi:MULTISPECIES: hypothetical protein [unclassified Sphingomonas]|uniref:hypothetical protein n=1 Tax=unclassified Sphingomonas TaxID=196159 RepID=UPI00286687F2|nr:MULTISPECIES: hypothetical protein [unclassified Sphingomonas]MDR6115061.1 hypothetical protein [Sphingomonas sp. SORGH_AS_0789]MDR6151265.1 hypothetical protein [Sphingomonas sp. SORGH_AS_0742]